MFRMKVVRNIGDFSKKRFGEPGTIITVSDEGLFTAKDGCSYNSTLDGDMRNTPEKFTKYFMSGYAGNYYKTEFAFTPENPDQFKYEVGQSFIVDSIEKVQLHLLKGKIEKGSKITISKTLDDMLYKYLINDIERMSEEEMNIMTLNGKTIFVEEEKVAFEVKVLRNIGEGSMERFGKPGTIQKVNSDGTFITRDGYRYNCEEEGKRRNTPEKFVEYFNNYHCGVYYKTEFELINPEEEEAGFKYEKGQTFIINSIKDVKLGALEGLVDRGDKIELTDIMDDIVFKYLINGRVRMSLREMNILTNEGKTLVLKEDIAFVMEVVKNIGQHSEECFGEPGSIIKVEYSGRFIDKEYDCWGDSQFNDNNERDTPESFIKYFQENDGYKTDFKLLIDNRKIKPTVLEPDEIIADEIELNEEYISLEYGIKKNQMYNITYRPARQVGKCTIEGYITIFTPEKIHFKTDDGMYILEASSIAEVSPKIIQNIKHKEVF